MDVAHILFRSAERYPTNPLWISHDRPVVSYRHGADRVASFARTLLERVEQGDRVAILTTNRYEGMEAYFGALAAGYAAVTLNARGHLDDHRHVLSDSGASVLVCDAELVEQVMPLRGESAAIREYVCFGADADGWDRFEDWVGRGGERPDVLIDPDDPAWLFYTSGTTGKPKGAVESHRNLLQMAQHFLIGLGDDLAPTDVMLHLAPISHGSCSVAYPHIAVGAANAFPRTRSFDADVVFRTIEDLGVTATMLAPTMIHMLLEALPSDVPLPYDLSTLKTIVYGAAPMPVADLERALAVFGPVFVQFYGQAEAAATITCLPKSEHRLDGDATTLARLGSAGRETFGTRVRIVDPDGRPLPANTTGEIAVRGALVMPGYWNNPTATAEAIPDGWLRTGDAGYLDDDGYLFITDRVKDMIISGGSNVYAREVEDVLLRHPDISAVAVFGLPDERWGEAVAAVVVPRAGSELAGDTVLEYAREHLASYKKPRHVWIADSLPTSAYGKVLKRSLRDHYGAEARR